ncbi:MAG: tetratricopeptide repeat protein [Planctomycetia bacterium]|nr:MAG: tetratricopeptide repeat protein [Planctomycetia bacterium]
MAQPVTRPDPPRFTDADKARARQWFKKAADSREKLEHDFAIESYVQGLGYWPDAVEDALQPMRSLALQRLQAGGKKAGMMEALRHPVNGKDPKQNYLNALWMLMKDPLEAGHAEAVVRNAARCGFFGAALWAAPLMLELLRKDKKPNLARFKALRDALVEAADWADAAGINEYPGALLEQAANSLEYLRARVPADDTIRNELRDVSSRLTIVRGKYQESDSFRGSVRDGDSQKLLHDAERVQQGESTLDALIAAARREVQQHPGVAAKLNALVDALLKREDPAEEAEAIELLMRAYADSQNYSFKMRADDIRLRILSRQARALVEQARASGDEDDRVQARLAASELLQAELEMWRERAENYPTDLRTKARLGAVLFKAKQYDEAIPILQQAQNEPRSRTRCMLLIARCFLEKGAASEACEILREAVDQYEIPGDELHREMTYWLGRSLEAAGDKAGAMTTYGKLLRTDYNYADGDARKRHDALRASGG